MTKTWLLVLISPVGNKMEIVLYVLVIKVNSSDVTAYNG